MSHRWFYIADYQPEHDTPFPLGPDEQFEHDTSVLLGLNGQFKHDTAVLIGSEDQPESVTPVDPSVKSQYEGEASQFHKTDHQLLLGAVCPRIRLTL